MKKSNNKKFKFLSHLYILQSLFHCSEIIPGNRGLYSVSNKTDSIKIWLRLYNLWQIYEHQLN